MALERNSAPGIDTGLDRPPRQQAKRVPEPILSARSRCTDELLGPPQGLGRIDGGNLCVRCGVDGVALRVIGALHARDLGYDQLDAKDRAVVEEIFVPVFGRCAKRNDLRLDLLTAGLPELACSRHALL